MLKEQGKVFLYLYMVRYFFISLFFGLGAGLISLMWADLVFGQPAQIIIIRHAEKPEKGPCLSMRGEQRAAALPYYFESSELLVKSPLRAVFAEYKNKPLAALRSLETCKKIADHFGLSTDFSYHPSQSKELALGLLSNELLKGASVLICWNHTDIIDLVEALGGKGLTSWTEDIYDQTVILSYTSGNKISQQISLQKLLYGDRSKESDQIIAIESISARCEEPVNLVDSSLN
jgi:hypothetical protein